MSKLINEDESKINLYDSEYLLEFGLETIIREWWIVNVIVKSRC